MRARLPASVVLIGLVSFFTDVASEMILPLLPALVLGTLGAAPVWLGAVDGIADAVAAVLKLKAGQLSDRTGTRKPWLLAGYGLSTAARPLISLAASPVHVVLVRALDRVGKGVRSAPRDALLSEAVPAADAPRAFALHRMMDHAGAVVGPLVASALLLWGLSVRSVIAWAWLPGACALVALLFVREAARARPPGPAANAVAASLPPQTRRFLLAVSLFGVGALPDMFLLVRARELGLDDALLPLVWVALHVAKVLAAGTIARRAHTPLRALQLGWLLVGGGAVALLSSSLGVVWASAVVVGLGHGIREPLEKEVVRAGADADARGHAFGRYHLVTGFASLGAGLLIGGLWTLWGVAAAVPVFAMAAALSIALVGAVVAPVVPPAAGP